MVEGHSDVQILNLYGCSCRDERHFITLVSEKEWLLILCAYHFVAWNRTVVDIQPSI